MNGNVEPTIEQQLEGALDFLRGGGHPTLREWMALSVRERCALQRARAILAVEDALRAARAHVAPAEVAAEADGGDALAQILCDQHSTAFASALAGREIA